jgi:hypothetical protein
MSVEGLETFVIVKGVILEPLGLFAWTLAWNRWLAFPRPAIDKAAALLAIANACAALAGDDFALLRSVTRIGFAILLLLVAARVMRRGVADRPIACLAMILIATGQFAEALWTLDVPGIWFPYGIGVSRTQFAYALLTPILTMLLARRAFRVFPARRSTPPVQGLVQ